MNNERTIRNENHSDTKPEQDFYLNLNTEKGQSDLSFEDVLEFLDRVLPETNQMTEIRTRQSFYQADGVDGYSGICDFCGRPMKLAHAHHTHDGRIRCQDCSASQVLSQEEFEKIYTECRKNFQSFFGVQLTDGIKAQLTESLFKDLPQSLILPSKDSHLNRQMGLVFSADGSFGIRIQAGISRQACISALISSFALIWVYLSWDLGRLIMLAQQLNPQDPQKMIDALIGGFRLWSSVEYFYLMNEKSFASKSDEMLCFSQTPEAAGYRLYRRTYPFRENKRLAFKHPYFLRIPVDLNALQQMLKD